MKGPTQTDQPEMVIADEPSLEEQCRILIAKLQSRNPTRRLRAARALCSVPFPIVPLLVAALDDTTPEHKEAILATLGLLGRRAQSAVPAIEKLCEDEQLGKTAQATLQRIRRRFHLDRETLLHAAMTSSILLMVSLGAVKEGSEWLEVWRQLQGPGRAIALSWGLIGGVAGYFVGATIPYGKMAWKGAKVLGVVGIYVGALLGRIVGELLAPLLSALGG